MCNKTLSVRKGFNNQPAIEDDRYIFYIIKVCIKASLFLYLVEREELKECRDGDDIRRESDCDFLRKKVIQDDYNEDK